MLDENGLERGSCIVHLKDDVEWTTPDGVFIKGVFMDKKFLLVAQHSHEYAHTSLLVKGSLRVWKDEVYVGDFCAPCTIDIEAKTKHRFLSLEEGTALYCIHNVSQTTGKVAIHEEHILKELA